MFSSTGPALGYIGIVFAPFHPVVRLASHVCQDDADSSSPPDFQWSARGGGRLRSGRIRVDRSWIELRSRSVARCAIPPLLTSSMAENRDDSLEKDKLDCPAKRSPPHSPRSSSFPVISATHRSANCDKTDSGRRSSSDESHKLKIEDHAVDQTSIANHREDETIAANGGPPFVTGDTPNDVAAQESSEPCPVDNLHNGSASSTLPSSDLRTDRSNIPCRSALVKLVQLRRPGRRAARIGIRIIPRKPRPDERFVLGPITSNLGENITVFNPEVVPGFQQEFTTIFGTEAVEKLAVASKLHASSGQYLPIQVRDLFPTLSEPVSALGMANALRTEHDLPRLTVNKGNRIALRRAVAQMREKLYVELISALSLPLAPTALETDDEMETESIDDTDQPQYSVQDPSESFPSRESGDPSLPGSRA